MSNHDGDGSSRRDRVEASSRVSLGPTSSQVWSVAGFVGIGGASYLVDTGLLLVLTQALNWEAWSAGTVGYVTSVVLNFVLNRALFRGRRASSQLSRQTRRYLLLLGANYVVTLVGLSLAEATNTNLFYAKTGLVVVIAVWNFVLYRRWVFA